MTRYGLLRLAHAVVLTTILMFHATGVSGQKLSDDQIKIAASATPMQAKAAREFFRKHGNVRFFGYSNYQPKILHLRDPKLRDEAIGPLQYLVGLEELYLAGLPISDEGLKSLKGLRNLKSLVLSGPSRSGSASETPPVTMKLNGSGLQVVAKLPQLEKLWLNRLPIDAKHLNAFSHATKLREIWLSSAASDGRLSTLGPELLALQEVPNLRLLRVMVRHDVRKSPEEKPLHKLSGPLFAKWKSSATLKHLVLSGVELDSKAWASLQKFRSLESLEYRVPTSEIDWETLSKLPNLRQIRLAGVADKALVGIEKCKQIRSLRLEFSITDEGLASLTGLSNLQSLSLWYCPVTGQSLKDGERMKSLKTLRLTGSKWDDQGLKKLASLPALHSIDLERTRVTTKGLKLLPDIETLRKVVPPIPWDDSGTGVSDPETIRVIEELRKQAPHIEFKMKLDVPS